MNKDLKILFDSVDDEHDKDEDGCKIALRPDLLNFSSIGSSAGVKFSGLA